jgi:hypothetical protein
MIGKEISRRSRSVCLESLTLLLTLSPLLDEAFGRAEAKRGARADIE